MRIRNGTLTIASPPGRTSSRRFAAARHGFGRCSSTCSQNTTSASGWAATIGAQVELRVGGRAIGPEEQTAATVAADLEGVERRQREPREFLLDRSLHGDPAPEREAAESFVPAEAVDQPAEKHIGD